MGAKEKLFPPKRALIEPGTRNVPQNEKRNNFYENIINK